MKNKDLLVNSVLRADLLLSDYTLTTDTKEKETFLEVLSNYIYAIDNNQTTLVYQKLCDSNGSEKDLYTGILIDLLEQLKTEVA